MRIHAILRDLIVGKTLTAAIVILGFSQAVSAEEKKVLISVQENKFSPQKVEVPADTSFVLQVTNNSKSTIEFESFKLDREKPVEPGETVSIRIPALRAGSYDFYDDFHQDIPEGELIVK